MFEVQYNEEMEAEIQRLEARNRAIATGHPEWNNACAVCGCELSDVSVDRCCNCKCSITALELPKNDKMKITEQVLSGTAIADALDYLAALRLDIFPEYPYLYQGRREDELTYLRTYAETPDACVILAYDDLTVIGAAAGMPLIHEDAQMLKAFDGTAFSLNEAYYVGELLFRPAYRNCGLGRKLLDRFVGHILSLGRYRTLTCATVERPADHPLRPPDYIPITRFLAHTGFARLPGVTTHFIWCETDGVKRDHPMQFWSKELM